MSLLNESGLVTECHRLHRVPLRNFTPGNLRIMIGQDFGLEYLVPLALQRLHEDALTEGNFYPGDLLVSVLRSDKRFWQRHPELREQLLALTQKAIASFPMIPEIASKTVTRVVTKALEGFQQHLPKV